MGWAEDYQAKKEEAQRRTRLQVSNQLGYDPEVASRVFGVAAKTKLPSQVVAEDLDGLEEQLKRDEFNYDDYTDVVNGSPVFNKFAAEDPYNYAILERDRKPLTRLERTLEPIFQGWDSGWGMIELAEIRDRQLAGDVREGDDARMRDLRTLTSGASTYFGVENKFMKALVMTGQQLPIQSWLVSESFDEIAIGLAAGAMYGAATGVVGGPAGSTIGTGAGALTGAGAGFFAGRTEAAFRLERGLAYDEYSELGFSEEDSRRIANMVGVANAAAESIGLGALTKRLPGFRNIQRNATDQAVRKIFNVPTFKQGLARATLQYGEGMATELVTEIFQESTLIAGREYLKSQARATGDMRPEMMPMSGDEFWASVGEIAIATMYGTSIIGGMGPVTNMRADAMAARQAKERQQMFAALGEAATESETRTKAPEAWRAFVEQIQKDGPLTEIRIDREGWRKYWQGKEIDPADAAAELGLDPEQLEGDPTDVVIPLAAYVDKIAPTEHHGALMPDLRAREGEMTQRDAESWYAQKDEVIARVEGAIKAEFDQTVDEQIVEELEEELVAAGNSPSAAKTQARLHAAIMSVTALRAGMDPMALHRSRLAGVRKEVPVELSGRDVDMKIDPLLDRIRNNDFPKQREIFGDSLIDMIKEAGGIQDEGGELTARDFGKQFVGVISKEGKSLDAIAELASEQGYITAYDQDLLMQAIDRELAGTQVFSRTAEVNRDLEELQGIMEQAAQFFTTEGFDLNEMSNADVREAIKGIKTLDQSSQTDLDAYTKLLVLAIEKDPALLTQVYRKMPRISDEQDFSSVTFTDKFVNEDGRTGTVTINAQDAYDESVNDRNALKQLLDCVNG